MRAATVVQVWSLAGLVLSFTACFILLVIAPLDVFTHRCEFMLDTNSAVATRVWNAGRLTSTTLTWTMSDLPCCRSWWWRGWWRWGILTESASIRRITDAASTSSRDDTDALVLTFHRRLFGAQTEPQRRMFATPFTSHSYTDTHTHR